MLEKIQLETLKEDEEYSWREVELPALAHPELERESCERRRGRHILIAVDHGPNSKHAFDWAITHLCRLADTIHLLHVVSSRSLFPKPSMMYGLPEMQSKATTLFSAYAQVAASMMLVRSMANEFIPLIPPSLRSYIHSAISYLFTPLSNHITIVIDDQAGMSRNQVYESAEIYLSTKISPTTDRFKVNKTPKQKSINVSMTKDEEITDLFNEKIVLKWRFTFQEARSDQGAHTPEKRYFELTFSKEYKDTVLNEYLPFVMEKAKEIKAKERVVKLYTRDCPRFDEDYDSGVPGLWGSVNLDHPATFDTLAMNKEMKKAIIDDLDRFLKRRDYYKKVGKAWKRGYLLYGPPGTGKSSLVAAMANYLKFDIYDLELTSLYSNSQLRRILVSTTNRSIILIEDIDCSVEMQDRELGQESNSKLTLSGLLNFIDGLWSSCGDERIIVFTTNYKEKIDPALLRPGRMDMHIHMSYCTSEGFKTLAFNYLGLENVEEHSHFSAIESLMDEVEVTPAEVAEELMRSEDSDLALGGVVNFLKRKREEDEETKNVERFPGLPTGPLGFYNAPDIQKPKRSKTDRIIRKTLKNSAYKRPPSIIRPPRFRPPRPPTFRPHSFIRPPRPPTFRPHSFIRPPSFGGAFPFRRGRGGLMIQ